MKCSLLMIVAIFLPLGACADAGESMTEATISQEIPEDVQELLRRSVKNQVFVKGGGFQMGDFGTYITKKSFNEGSFDYKYVDKDHPDAMWLPWLRPDFDLKKQTSEPVHKVTLSSYSIGKYEVTFSEYDVYTRSEGKATLAEHKIGKQSRRPKNPAHMMTWENARNYCLWLGKHTGLSFDLPTEAQWEYAARSRGKDVAYGTDSGMPQKGTNINSSLGVKKVGSYPPNPLGLYDMSGNAKEWVLDWFDPDYYKVSPENNPKGPKQGEKRVVRSAKVVLKRLHEKPKADPDTAKEFGFKGHAYVGFRCAVNEEKPVTLK